MKKAIFLDRDGTLVIDSGYVYKVEDFKLHRGVIEGLKLLKEFALFIITNQSGIGRGYYTEEDMHKYNNHMLKVLKDNGIRINKIYFCPHVKEHNCDCRKPNIKFIKEAEKEYYIDIKRSYVVGDHASDIQLAKNAGCTSIYLLTGHGKKHLEDAKKLDPQFIAKDFLDATNWIIKNENRK